MMCNAHHAAAASSASLLSAMALRTTAIGLCLQQRFKDLSLGSEGWCGLHAHQQRSQAGNCGQPTGVYIHPARTPN